MSLPSDLWKTLRDEFTAWYEVSELPDSWEEWTSTEFEQMTSRTASRLRRNVQEVRLSALVTLLREASRQRRGELVRQIEGWTRFGWSDEEEDWITLRRLLTTFANKLEQ